MASHSHRRAGIAAVLAGFLLGAVGGLTACGAGGESPSARPSAGSSARSIERPASDEPDTTGTGEPDRTTEPAEISRPPTRTAAVAPEPTRSSRTSTPAETTTLPPTSAAAVAPEPTRSSRISTPAETTPIPVASTSAAAASAEDQGPGWFGWLLLIVLVAALIAGGLLVYRSQRRSAWDSEAGALESETRSVAAIRQPPVLSTTTTGQRGLAWPPVRAALIDLQSRWNALTEHALGERRRAWSSRISELLQELIEAVDVENEALAVGRDWMLSRPRVDRAEQALVAILAVQPRSEQPPAGETGPPAFQT